MNNLNAVDLLHSLRATTWIVDSYGDDDLATALQAVPLSRLPELVAKVEKAIVETVRAYDGQPPADPFVSAVAAVLAKVMSGETLTQGERETAHDGMEALRNGLADLL